MEHLQAVLKLIDPLLKNKSIDLKYWKRFMRPDVNTIELAHLYFIPKPHKVNHMLIYLIKNLSSLIDCFSIDKLVHLYDLLFHQFE